MLVLSGCFVVWLSGCFVVWLIVRLQANYKSGKTIRHQIIKL